MGQALPVEAVGDAELPHQVDRVLLQEAGADAAFDVVAVAALEDDRVDAAGVEEEGEGEAGGAGADDPDLGALVSHGQELA